MTDIAETPDTVASRKTAAVSKCDLCGHEEQHALAAPSPARCRIVMCGHCGLFYASPSLAPDLLDKFYDEEFEGDAGTNKRLKGGGIEPRKVNIEERIARTWAMPLIQSHVDVRGKSVLDVRCRSGSLAAALTEAGAQVTAIDPLEPNVRYAEKRNVIGDVRFIPIENFERMDVFEDAQFDVITALSIHLLSHSPSPNRLLHRLRALLKPGGYLFLDEKDVFHPVRATGETVFDSGPAHFFHFTTDSMRNYFEACGLEILECGIDPKRKKSTRHIRSVVRRPANASNGSGTRPQACDRDKVIAALEQAEHKLMRNNGFNKFMKSARRTARKIWN